VPVEQVAQRTDHGGRVADRQLGLRPGHGRVEVLVQPGIPRAGSPAPRQAGQGLPPPQTTRLAEQRNPPARRATDAASLLDQCAESEDVHPDRIDVQGVPAAPTDDGHRICPRLTSLFQQPADPGQVRLQGSPGPLRRCRPPHPVHQHRHRNGTARVDRERGQHLTLLRRPHGQHLTAGMHLDRPQQPKLHRGPLRGHRRYV
jgi:hypothetical protein